MNAGQRDAPFTPSHAPHRPSAHAGSKAYTGWHRAYEQALEDEEVIRGIRHTAGSQDAPHPGDAHSGMHTPLRTSFAAATEAGAGGGTTPLPLRCSPLIVDAAEQLLEAYLGHVRTATASLEAAAYNIAGQEKIAMLMLDQVRNRLLKVDVAASSVSAAAGLGACIASIFGMNTPAPILANVPEPGSPGSRYDTWLFATVTSLIGLMIFSFIIGVISFLYGSRCRPALHPPPVAHALTTSRRRLRHKRQSVAGGGPHETSFDDDDASPRMRSRSNSLIRRQALRWPSFSLLPRPSHGSLNRDLLPSRVEQTTDLEETPPVAPGSPTHQPEQSTPARIN